VIEWPGACIWGFEEPARCTPSLPGTFGQRRDCRVDFGPEDAWPNRADEPAPLAFPELAQACAIVGACGVMPGDPAEVTTHCAQTINADEEFAIPVGSRALDLLPPADVRWTYFARAAIAELEGGGDCAGVRALLPARPPPIVCGSEGCIWRAPQLPSVSCAGDVATLNMDGEIFVRDCARVYARCDTTSPTGCTDRQVVPCQPSEGDRENRDRCYGQIKIGCTLAGFISFGDCTRYPGAYCADGPSTLEAYCAYPPAGPCSSREQTCTDGQTLRLCVFGMLVDVDCAALGFAGCERAACVP
jgi:hypothetical protein